MMAQNTQPVLSQTQHQQQPPHSNAQLPQHNIGEINNNSNNNVHTHNHNNNHNTNISGNSSTDDLNENGNSSNNNANPIGNNNNNIILTTQQHATMFGGIGLSNTNTQQIYMNPATGTVHAAHPTHAPMFSTMTHMGNALYVNNIPANINIPTAAGWTYLQGSGYAEMQTDANGAMIQSLPGIQTIQGVGINSTAPQAQQAQDQPHHPQSMSMHRTRNRGVPRNITRHARDYNNRHHQHVQHGNVSAATESSVDLSIAQQTIGDGTQTIMTATGPGTVCTPTQYNTQPQYPHAPAHTPYQYAYPAYFATQNPMLHPGAHTAVTAQTNTSGQPMYVSSLPIYNTQQLYNCSYIYPSVVNSTEYQYMPGAEEVQTVAFDARQNVDGGSGGAILQQQHQLWHPNSMFADDYTVNPEMSAVPVTLVPVSVGCDEYPQNSALDTAETLSPNYALYETQQIPDLTQQIDCLQIYDETQHGDENNPIVQLACDDLQKKCTEEGSEVAGSLPLAQETTIAANNNGVIPEDYLLEKVTRPQNPQISVLVNDQKKQELFESCNYIANAKMNCNAAELPDDTIQQSQSQQQQHVPVLEKANELPYDLYNQYQTCPITKVEANLTETVMSTAAKTSEPTIINAYSNDVQNLELLPNSESMTTPPHTIKPQIQPSQGTAPTTTKIEGSSSSGMALRYIVSGKTSSVTQSTAVSKHQQQGQQRQISLKQHSQTEPEQRKLSSSNLSVTTGDSGNPAQQKHKQQIRRKHSGAEQMASMNSSASVGNDKYMQTTKTMSWTNSSSQHKKSTTSVAVTATPDGNPQHGRKHINAIQTQPGHQQFQQQNQHSINSSVSTTRNQSSMRTTTISPTNNMQYSIENQRIDKPKCKSNVSTISTSTASTTVVPNQLGQQLVTAVAAPLRGPPQRQFEVNANSDFKNSSDKETNASSDITYKQYPGFEQKKAIPRTTSPTTGPTVVPTVFTKPETDNIAAKMSTNGLDDTVSLGTLQSSVLIPKSDNIDKNLEQVQLQHSISTTTTVPVPTSSKNVTTSWASLFNGGGSAHQSTTQTATNMQASTATVSKASFAGSSLHLPTQGKKQLISQKSVTQATDEKNQTANIGMVSQTALGASNVNTIANVQTKQQSNPIPITPGPMSYSAASAQGLSVANNASGSNNCSSTVGLTMTAATAVSSLTRQPQKLDEWTTKYAEFLAKQKTDLNPISLRPRGLTNRSNYCYINSTLQALLGCSPLYNLFRAIPKQMAAFSSVKTPTINAMMNFMGNFSLMPSGMRLRTNTRRGASHKGASKDDLGTELQCDSAFEPTEIYKLWNESRKEEGEGRQEDAEEFLGYVLNKLNDEMEEIINLIAKPKPQQNGKSDGQSEGEDGDSWQMICNYRNRSSITRQNDYRSTPLSDIFRGELRSRLLREGEHSTDVIQPFYTLQLNIEKVSSVKEALEVLSGRDQLEGVTGSKTKQEVLAWQQMTIEKLPIILILHLKYFDYRQDGLNKILKKVDFPIELKIDPKIMGTKKYPQRQRTYRLIAVVYHDGKEASKGHYIADVYHTGYSNWLRYDDNSVKPVSENHVLVPRSPRVPYLLYYRRCDTMPQQPAQPAQQQQQQQQQQSSHYQNNHVSNSQAQQTHAGGDHRSARH